MASTIGIKIANGEFYSIIEEHSAAKKRLILTTVHDRQQSVQIDLYRSVTRTMADAQYMGSLVVENIKPNAKGEPSIEMVISSNMDGDITADAVNLDTGAKGEHQILNVSLQSLDEESREDELPDFELDGNDFEASEPPSGLYQETEIIRQEEEEKKKFPWVLVILLGILIVLGLLAVWYFFFKDKRGLSFNREKPGTELSTAETPEPRPNQAEEPPTPPPPPPPPAPPPPVEQPPVQAAAPPAPPPPPPAEKPPAQAAAPPPVSPPVIKAPSAPPPARPQTTAARKRPPAPVWSYKVPATIPRNGVAYKVRYGDTLWDIAGAFYRNPWQYQRIARFNNIRNPDKIVSGTTIRIPPRN